MNYTLCKFKTNNEKKTHCEILFKIMIYVDKVENIQKRNIHERMFQIIL